MHCLLINVAHVMGVSVTFQTADGSMRGFFGHPCQTHPPTSLQKVRTSFSSSNDRVKNFGSPPHRPLALRVRSSPRTAAHGVGGGGDTPPGCSGGAAQRPPHPHRGPHRHHGLRAAGRHPPCRPAQGTALRLEAHVLWEGSSPKPAGCCLGNFFSVFFIHIF